jgi:hypothetical protein
MGFAGVFILQFPLKQWLQRHGKRVYFLMKLGLNRFQLTKQY